jgi:hypothetical protein
VVLEGSNGRHFSGIIARSSRRWTSSPSSPRPFDCSTYLS